MTPVDCNLPAKPRLPVAPLSRSGEDGCPDAFAACFDEDAAELLLIRDNRLRSWIREACEECGCGASPDGGAIAPSAAPASSPPPDARQREPGAHFGLRRSINWPRWLKPRAPALVYRVISTRRCG